MNLIITGSSGILGNHVCRILKKNNNLNVIKFQGNIVNENEVFKNFEKIKSLDYIIHLAAMVPVHLVEKNPPLAFSTNVNGTINLLSACSYFNLKPYFFYASTSHIYAPSNQPIKEDFKKTPSSLYGKTKLLGEVTAYEMCHLNNQSFCAGRIFSFFDQKQLPPFLYASIKKRLMEEDLSKPFFIRNGNSVRDFMTAENVSKIIVDLCIRRITGPINIGSGIGTKVSSFVRSLSKQKIVIDTNREKNFLVANVSRLNELKNG